jgi:hypothetical protein
MSNILWKMNPTIFRNTGLSSCCTFNAKSTPNIGNDTTTGSYTGNGRCMLNIEGIIDPKNIFKSTNSYLTPVSSAYSFDICDLVGIVYTANKFNCGTLEPQNKILTDIFLEI